MTTTHAPLAPKRSDAQKFAIDLLIGGVSASVSKTAVAPIERVKILLQVQYSHKDIPADKRYNGIIDAFIRVPKEQGFLSFWRGNLTNVIRYFPTQAFNFAFNDLYKSILLKNMKRENNVLSYSLRTLVSGGLAGCSSLCIVYPLDFIRTRLSADISHHTNREYKGLVDCTLKTVRNEGVGALYRGFSISLQTYFIYRSVYFGLYDAIRNQVHTDKKKLPFYASFAIAQGVTVLSSYLTYPWDTVRRRMIVKGQLSTSKAVSAARKIVREEGFRGLYKGALANIFRSAGGALVMALYEEIHKHI
uniref:ADP/ATP translocase n=1 Tax=Caenorhabditis japonica TaxID=281687 RepID=A0A8R1HND3_CAEJA